jgi:hypothetical protein
MARKLETRYTFTPGAAGVGTVTIDALYKLSEILMITNVTDNIVIYNFSDTSRGGVLTQTVSSTAPTTTITLDFDTSSMSSGDVLQVYVEQHQVVFKPEERFIDPVSKFRISQPNTLIDTDFEYGLQATKWETLELVNNIPGFFSRTGDTPLTVTGITAVSGSTTLTVIAPAHGLTVGTPIDVRGLRQATLEGSYLVGTVPDADTFTFTARVTSTITGTVSGAYTTLTPGKFYAGSDIAYATIETDGATPSNITVTTTYNPGFVANTEFYLVNTLGSTETSFDSATAINFQDSDFISATFDPNGGGSVHTSASRVVDPWDSLSTFNTRYFYAGAGGNVGTRSITITSHGFSGNNIPVALIPGPNSTAPTGLIANAGYIVKTVDTNTISLSSNVGGVDHALTSGSGSGIVGLYQGWLVTAVNATNDQLTLAGPTTFFNNTANITSSTQMLWFTSNTTSGLQTVAGSIFAKSVPGQLYDGTSGTILYWRGTTGQNVISTTAAGGGANIDITGAAVSNNTVIVPITTNSNGNSLYIPNHGFLNNEPYLYYSGGGTAIGGLTTNTTYFIDFISSTQFGLKPTVGGARINLTSYAATGTTHSLSYSRPRANANTISISSHGFTDGAVVVYDSNGGSAIGGLVDDSTYFVRDATTNDFRLAESSGGNPIDLTSAGTGTQKFTQAATGTFDGTYLVSNVASSTQFRLTSAFTVPFVTKTFANTDVYTGNSTVIITDHRFGTGSNVLYANGGGTTIGGLTSGTYYFVYRQNKDRIRLAANIESALAGTPLLTLSSAGTGSAHAFTFRGVAGENKGTGTITVATGNTTIVGSGTSFLRTFKSGDTLIINNTTDTVVRTINYVASDTKLVANSDPGISGSGLSYLVPTSLYIKSGAFTLHRPFDGGVEINAGYRADTQIVRQTRRYFRYQSGKGMQSSFAINFNPPTDIQELSAVGTTATAVTRKVHGLRVDQQFKVRDAEVQSGVNYFNGTFSVVSIPTETSFTYTLSGSPSVATADGFPSLIVTDWGGSRMRAGMYDFQNGMFFEFDGTNLYCVRRNSTQQLAGTVSLVYRSNTVTGTGSAFLRQLEVGDNVVIRGGSYKITNIASNSNMTIQPAYRGTTTDEVIISKTVDTKVAQNSWSLDACDGHGPSRYVLDTTRIQMVYMDYSWYGAGKVRFGFKGVDGEVFYCHEFKHNNRENEAYLRSGNLPARYEILNVGAPLYAPSLAHWGTSVIMDGTFEDDNAYLFTAPSKFLTFSGASATVTGETGGTYTYVNADGTTGNTISTSANLTFATQSPAGGTNAAVNTTAETITFNFNHGLVTGQLVRYQHVAGAIIGGLTNATYYYAIRLTNQVIRLAATPAAATANSAVNLTTTPTGTHVFVNTFAFVPTKTTVPGYGSRIIHRFITTGTGFAAIGNVPFGTQISAASTSGRGTAIVYRVQAATTPSGGAIVDFFFADAVVDPATSSTNGPLGSTGFLAAGTSQAIVHTLGSSASIPSSIPLISVRLAPSVDSSLTGALGVRDVINRMQQTLKSVGASTTHDIELRLVLNAQLDNNTWVSQGVPSLCQLVLHNDGDAVSGGVNVFNFRATGNSPSSSGLRTANTFSADISSILALGNAILGGDGVYPDGPDILSLVAVPLSTSGITVNSPFSVAGRITWSESQA